MADTESSVVIVKQFSKDLPRQELVDFLSCCGNLNALTVVADQADNTLGIGIACYKEVAAAKIAVQLNGSTLRNKVITCRIAPNTFMAPPANPNDGPLPVNLDADKLTPASVFTTLISKGFVLSPELMETYQKKPSKDPAKVDATHLMGTCSIQSAHGTFLRAHSGKDSNVDLQESASAWETWTIESLGENLVSIKSIHNTLLCAHRGGCGSKVTVTAKSTAETQWILIQHDDGSGFTFQSCYGTYLRAYPGGEGAKVDLQTKYGAWEVFQIAGRILTKAIRSCHGTYVRAHPGGDGAKVDLKPSCGPWETFVLEKLSDDKIAIKTMHGTYLCAHPGGEGAKVDCQTRVGMSEKWSLVEHDGNRYSFLSCHGTYLRANRGGEGAKLDLQTKVGNHEIFTIEEGTKANIVGVVGAKLAGSVNSLSEGLGKLKFGGNK